MCHISNIILEVGRDPSSGDKEFAKVVCRLYFTQMEKNLNMPFHVKAHLYGINDQLYYDINRDEESQKVPVENSDDYVGYIGFAAVHPDGNHYKDVELYREWDFEEQEGGDEEYKVSVHACPNNCTDFRWGREVPASTD